MRIRSLPAVLLLLSIAALAQSLDDGHTWTGRLRLKGTPEQLRSALGSQDASVREPMETFPLGSAGGSSIEARITYANLDGDSERIERDRLLLARRYWTGAVTTPSLTDFRHASKVECNSLARDSAGA